MFGKLKIPIISIIAVATVGLLFNMSISANTHNGACQTVTDDSQITLTTAKQKKSGLLYTRTDVYDRPVYAHYIGQDYNQVGHRVGTPEIPSNMTHWLNNKQVTTPSGQKVYPWNRGHLIGNQFAGQSSNISTNIVAETEYTNQKLMTYYEGGMKTSNANALDNWLALHPSYYLDYSVTANYNNAKDQIPKSVTLRYRGVDAQNKPIEIKLPNDTQVGSGQQSTDASSYTTITLANIEPGYDINYQTGELSISNQNDKSNASTTTSGNTKEVISDAAKNIQKVRKSAHAKYENQAKKSNKLIYILPVLAVIVFLAWLKQRKR